MRPTDWTDAQANKLVKLYRKGHSYSAIARALLPLGKTISPQAVASKAKSMGLTRQYTALQWSPEEDARLAELTETGKTDEAIALVMRAEFPERRLYNRNMIVGARYRLGLAKPFKRNATPRRKTGSKPAPLAPERLGCKWVTNARQLRQQRPHYCGVDADGDWCAEHEAVLHGRKVAG